MPCAVEGCVRATIARGWCKNHYYRWARNGSPTAGRVDNGEPLKFFETVVMVYDGTECLVWPYSVTPKGYPRLERKIATRTLCERINGKPPTPKHEAAHSCGNGHLRCITKRHLSWKTRRQNAADMVVHGTVLRGADVIGSKINSNDVARIRELCGTMPQTAIADLFGITQSNVSAIKLGKSWSWL